LPVPESPMKMTLSRPSIEVRFASARYSVPHRLVGRAVELQAAIAS
jgi:Mu transposase-like protein